MNDENGFIASTARDYDMEYHEVERIKNLWPDKFYEKLEEFLVERQNRRR